MRRRFGLLLLVALAVGATGPGHPAEPRKVRIGVLKLTSSAPIFVGVETGFFREAGIEPELVYSVDRWRGSRRS